MIESTLTQDQWHIFAQRIQPGCRCRRTERDGSWQEGILLENWPYRQIEIANGPPQPACLWRINIKIYLDYLYFQPFHRMGIVRAAVITLHFFMDDRWYDFYEVLDLPQR